MWYGVVIRELDQVSLRIMPPGGPVRGPLLREITSQTDSDAERRRSRCHSDLGCEADWRGTGAGIRRLFTRTAARDSQPRLRVLPGGCVPPFTHTVVQPFAGLSLENLQCRGRGT